MHLKLLLLAGLLGGLSLAWICAPDFAAHAIAQDSNSPKPGAAPARPNAVVADAFYPGFDPKKDKLPEPRDGGRVVVHSPGFPANLNFMIENSAVTRRMWHELHDGLLRQDLATFEFAPALAESFTVKDQLVPEGGDVASGSKVVSGMVYDFVLRKGVKWHDGADFDARDVLFSLRCFKNKHVPCDTKRYQFDKIARVESDSQHHVRVCFSEPYFLATGTFGALTILPAHIYDLSDERNPQKQAGASDEEQARFIVEHPANRQWIGLGPYQLAEWKNTTIVAKRWDGYWDKSRAGHVAEIVWREVRDDNAAITALLEGQLDFFDRLKGEDYFGGRTANATFEAAYYKGYSYGPQITYVGWNTRRETLKDVRVRTALAMSFDWDAFIASYYKGLAKRVTGEQFLEGPMYDAALAPLPFDLARATALLAESGWKDSDRDGLVDQGGAPLRIEYLYQAGNASGELLGQAFQANLKKVGVELVLQGREWTALRERTGKSDFDAVSMGWVTPPVVDPEQTWHSRWAGPGSENLSGLADPEVDRLIGEIQVELDPAKQKTLFASLQRRIYALQPYMFGVNVPRKFAMSKRVRNLECFVIDPGYSIRRWFVVEPPK